MGMGTVYFQRSRGKMGWGKGRMARHFAVRAVALTVVSEVMGETLMWGRHILVINIVLIGLAVDYLLTGLLGLAVEETEGRVARGIDGWMGKGDAEATRPLLANDGSATVEDQQNQASHASASARAETLSFWLHNLVLALLTYVTLFWNVWLSPSGGHCPAISVQPSSLNQTPIELLALTNTAAATEQPAYSGSRLGPWFDFWFYSVQNRWVMSGFRLSPGSRSASLACSTPRIMLYKRWTPKAVVAWNLGVAVCASRSVRRHTPAALR